MPSSLLEVTKQSDVKNQPDKVSNDAESICARSVILTFPGYPSRCTEILLNAEELPGAAAIGEKTKESNACSTTEDLPETSRCLKSSDRSLKSKAIKISKERKSDQALASEGEHNDLHASRKRQQNTSDSLVRTLPFLEKFSKRWLNFRTTRADSISDKKWPHEVQNIAKNISVEIEELNISLKHTRNNCSRSLPKAFYTLWKPKSLSMTNQVSQGKQSLERRRKYKAFRSPARKSNSFERIKSKNSETFYGDEPEKNIITTRSNASTGHLKLGCLSTQEDQTWRCIAEGDNCEQKSYEKVSNCEVCNSAEEQWQDKDRCSIQELSGKYHLTNQEILVSSEPLPELTTVDSPHQLTTTAQCSPRQLTTTTHSSPQQLMTTAQCSLQQLNSLQQLTITAQGSPLYSGTDSTNTGVMNIHLTQADYKSVKTPLSINEQERNCGCLVENKKAITHQKPEPQPAYSPNSFSASDYQKLSEEIKGVEFPEDVTNSCKYSYVNSSSKTHDCGGACIRQVSQYQTTNPDSNNCHYSFADDQNECSETRTALTSASSSDESLIKSFRSSEGLISPDETGSELGEGNIEKPYLREAVRSMQGKLQACNKPSTSEDPTERQRKHQSKCHNKCCKLTNAEYNQSVSSSSENDLHLLQPKHANNETSYEEKCKDSLNYSDNILSNSCTEKLSNDKQCCGVKTTCAYQDGEKISALYDMNQIVRDESKHSENKFNITETKYDNNKHLCGLSYDHTIKTSISNIENDKKYLAIEEDKSDRALEKCAFVAVKSSKLHQIFSKSANKLDTGGNTNATNLQIPQSIKHSNKALLPGRNLEIKTHTNNLNQHLQYVSMLKELDEPIKTICAGTPLAPSSSFDTIPLLRPLTASATVKHCATIPSSYVGKVKNAVSKARPSRSLSSILTKIKSIFARDRTVRKSANKSCSTSGNILGPRPTSVLQHSGSSKEISRAFRESNSNTIEVVSKTLCSSKATHWCLQANDTDIESKNFKQLSKGNQFPSPLLHILKEEQEVQHSTETTEDTLSGINAQEITQTRPGIKFCSGVTFTWKDDLNAFTAGQYNCATTDHSLHFEREPYGRSAPHYTFSPMNDCNDLEEYHSPTTTLAMKRSPILESIAEVSSIHEESTVDEPGVDGEKESLDENNALFEGKTAVASCCLNQASAGVVSDIIGDGQADQRISVPQISSSYEDCLRHLEDSYDDGFLQAPVKTHSMVNAREIAQAKSGVTKVMAFISQEVTIKQYPSYPDLTYLNNDDPSVNKTSRLEVPNIAVCDLEKEPLPVLKNSEIIGQSESSCFGAHGPSEFHDNLISNKHGDLASRRIWQCNSSLNLTTAEISKQLQPLNASQINAPESCVALNTMIPLPESSILLESHNNNEISSLESDSSPKASNSDHKLLQTIASVFALQRENYEMYSHLSPSTISLDTGKVIKGLFEDSVLLSPRNHSLDENSTGIGAQDSKRDVNSASNDFSQLICLNEENIQAMSGAITTTTIHHCPIIRDNLKPVHIQDCRHLDTEPESKESNIYCASQVYSSEEKQLLDSTGETSLTCTCNELPCVPERPCKTSVSQGCIKQLNLIESGADIPFDLRFQDNMVGNNFPQATKFGNKIIAMSTSTQNMLSTPQEDKTQQFFVENTSTIYNNYVNLFSTNTNDEAVQSITQRHMLQPKCSSNLKANHFLNERTDSPCMLNLSPTAPDFDESCDRNRYRTVASLSNTEFSTDTEVTDRHSLHLLTAESITLTETAISCDTDKYHSSGLHHEYHSGVPLGSVRYDQDVSPNMKCKQFRSQTFSDTCNSCLSDMDSDDTVADDEHCFSAEQLNEDDTSASISNSLGRRESLTLNDKNHLLKSTYSKSRSLKPRTILAKNLKIEKPKPLKLNTIFDSESSFDLQRRYRRPRTSSHENIKKTLNVLSRKDDEPIEVETVNPRSCLTGNPLTITIISSVFGAPEKSLTEGERHDKDVVADSRANKNSDITKCVSDTAGSDYVNTSNASEICQELSVSDCTKVKKFDHKGGGHKLETVSKKSNSFIRENKVSVAISQNESGGQIYSTLDDSLNSSPCDEIVEICVFETPSTISEESSMDVTARRPVSQMEDSTISRTEYPTNRTLSLFDCSGLPAAAYMQDTMSCDGRSHQNMVSRLAQKIRWSSRSSTKSYDFVSRSRHHLERCDKLIERSAEIIKRSREITCYSKRQMAYTAEKMNLKSYVDSHDVDITS